MGIETKKIKLMFIVTRCIRSGPIAVINHIVDHLDQGTFELHLVTLSEEGDNQSILKDMRGKFIYQHIPVGKIQALMGLYGDLKKYMRDIKPDVVHSTGVVPDYIISKICPSKQLMTAHANYKVDYRMLYGPICGSVLANAHIRVMKRGGTAIACSKSLRDIYKIEEEIEIGYIRNGVDCRYHKDVNSEGWRNKNKLPLDKKIFVYSASFNTRKNQKFLLESFVKLNEGGKKYDLLLLGDGPTYEKCVQDFSKYHFIHFAGMVRDVYEFLQISDYYISSSKQEGMPIALLEAMNQGLPYVVSDIPQHMEIYKMNKTIGAIYQEDDYGSFLLALEKIGGLSKETKGKEIHALVENEFSAEKMSKGYQDEYFRIAAKNRMGSFS